MREVAAAAVAEDAAATPLSSVDIGAGEAAVDDGFVKLFTVYAPEVIAQSVIAFIVRRKFKRTSAHVLTSEIS